MACNSIATVAARVALDLPETIARLVSNQAAAVVLLTALKEKYSQVSFTENPKGVALTAYNGAGYVNVQYSDGQVRVSQTGSWYSIDQGEVDQLAQELTELLRQAAGLLLQAMVQETISQVGTIERMQEVNGSMVYTVNV